MFTLENEIYTNFWNAMKGKNTTIVYWHLSLTMVVQLYLYNH